MWGASLAANVADGVMMAAAPLLAVTLTKSPVLISAMSGIVMLPWLLFAIPIGVLVDRIDRRHLLAGAHAIRFLVASLIVLAVTTHTITIWWLLLAAFIIGICEVAADTTAQSLIPQILTEDQFERGNSRLQISETVIQGFVGTPLSGFLYAAAVFLPFAANGVGYFVAAILATLIPVKFLQEQRAERVEKATTSFVAEMKFGVAYLVSHKQILRLVLTTAAIGFFFSMASSTSVLFILHQLHLKPAYFGTLLTIEGIGAIVGGFLAPKLSKRFGRSRTMAFGITTSAVLTLVIGFSPNIYFFAMVATLELFAVTQWNVLLMAVYQSTIPSELYGRIHGTRRTLVWGLMPFGSLLGGVVAKGGLRLPFYLGGTLCTVIALSSLRFFLTVGTEPTVDEVVAEG
jgi:MFS family permease